jgi:cholesterol transport system auxiliary component
MMTLNCMAASLRCLILASLAAIALTACQLPGAGDPPQLYTLTPKSTFNTDLPTVRWQLIVETPIAAAGLNTSRIALQRTPTSLDYFARSNWTDLAPLMVQTLIIESFDNTGKIVAVSRESTMLRADYLLKTELREFQAEYDNGGLPQVRVRINAKMLRIADRSIIANHTVERAVPAEKGDIASIILAYDEALGKVVRQIVEWALTAPPSPERPPPPRLGS